MFFKIAHICYCGNAADAIKKYGYRLLFSEQVHTMAITQKHLSRHIEDYKLSLWTKPGSISIEFLEFAEYSEQEGLVFPILPAAMPCVEIAGDKTFQLNEHKYIPASFLESPAFVSADLKVNEPVLNSLLLLSSDINQSIQFWSEMGLQCVGYSENYGILKLRCSFSRQDFFLYICKSDQKVTVREDINSPGFHLLGLFSNSAGKEHARMVSSGIEVTPVEEIEVNKKRLAIFYSRSPEGIIVEIISLK